MTETKYSPAPAAKPMAAVAQMLAAVVSPATPSLCMPRNMTPAPIKPTIKFDILNQIDVRVGTIEKVEDIEKSDKLVKLTVNFGDHKRGIVVGLKLERDDPKETEGKQALFVLNLEPREMMGIKSEGMLFDIGYPDKITPVLAMPEKPVPNGTRVG